MRIDLRTAGLDEAVAQRVRIACGLVAARDYVVRASGWDGTRCDIAIVDGDDAEGRRVADLAVRRGTPVIAIASRALPESPARFIPRGSCSAASIAAELGAALDGVRASRIGEQRNAGDAANRAPPAAMAAETAVADIALARLATESRIHGQDVDARVRGRAISLRPSLGRVYAHTLSDLLAARDLLGESGWQFVPAPHPSEPTARGEVSASLDAYYVAGALHARDNLPCFPAGSYGLKDWPDLGSLPSAVGALKVAQVLRKASVSWERLAQASGIPANEVNAYGWAFLAANLLTRSNDEPGTAAAAPAKKLPPLLSRLAERFGLSW